jgi:hypothetical protein
VAVAVILVANNNGHRRPTECDLLYIFCFDTVTVAVVTQQSSTATSTRLTDPLSDWLLIFEKI